MPGVDYAEAKGGVLYCHWDSHHYRTRTEIASAVVKISLLTPISNAASERTFSPRNKIGKEHCSELALDTMAAIPSVQKRRWVTRSFAQPRLFSECPILGKNNNLLQ